MLFPILAILQNAPWNLSVSVCEAADGAQRVQELSARAAMDRRCNKCNHHLPRIQCILYDFCPASLLLYTPASTPDRILHGHKLLQKKLRRQRNGGYLCTQWHLSTFLTWSKSADLLWPKKWPWPLEALFILLANCNNSAATSWDFIWTRFSNTKLCSLTTRALQEACRTLSCRSFCCSAQWKTWQAIWRMSIWAFLPWNLHRPWTLESNKNCS